MIRLNNLVLLLIFLTGSMSWGQDSKPSEKKQRVKRTLLQSYLLGTEDEMGYFEALDTQNYVNEVTQLNRIKNLLFDPKNFRFYEKWLKEIDSYSSKHPNAVASLAEQLQARWENKHIFQWEINNHDYVHNTREFANLGWGVGLVALLRNPVKATTDVNGVARYFAVFNKILLPALGFTIAGKTIGIISSELSKKNVHTPPSLIMNFAVPREATCLSQLEETDANNDLIGQCTGAGAAWIVYAAGTVRAANLAAQAGTAPAKIHPGVLIASIIVGVAVDSLTDYMLDYAQESELQDNLHKAIVKAKKITHKSPLKDQMAITFEILKAAYVLEAYYDLEVLQHARDYQMAVKDAVSDMTPLKGGESKEVADKFKADLTSKTKEADDKYLEKLIPLVVERAERVSDLFETHEIKEKFRLSSHFNPVNPPEAFKGLSKKKLNYYTGEFFNFIDLSRKYGKPFIRKDASLKELVNDPVVRSAFIDHITFFEDIDLAAEAMTGNFRGNADDMLIQVAAFLKRKLYKGIDEHIDNIYGRITKRRRYFSSFYLNLNSVKERLTKEK